jgi:hypothetical protein
MNTWEDALDRLDAAWCDGSGCMLGSVEQHQRGFVSYNPPTVHLSAAPDEDDREALHAALTKIGEAVAWQVWPEMDGPQRGIVAFDFATDQMRAHKVSVPKTITERRPEGDAPDVSLFEGDAQSAKEAPSMAEQEDDG